MEKRARFIKAVAILSAVLLGIGCVFCLFLPLPARVAVGEEAYVCVWEKSGTAAETYGSAYKCLNGAQENAILLKRSGERGIVAPSEEYKVAYSVLTRGTLGELYRLNPRLRRLEHAALWRAFGDRIWFDGGYFIWNGERIAVSKAEKREKFVLLNGTVSARNLIATAATELEVRSTAELSAPALLSTEIKAFAAEEPYATDGTALYLHTAGGTRLIAGAPQARTLTVSGNEFFDEGALACCERLEELTVPFVGNTVYTQAEGYRGEFAILFSVRGEYRVPASLKRVTVTGGRVPPYAFYACPEIREFTLCGLAAEQISGTAFLSCEGWERIHCPNAEILLPSAHTKTILPCGCALFERKGK